MTDSATETRISAYVMPSQCDRCCPITTHTDYATSYEHEPTCPNTIRGTIRAAHTLMDDGRRDCPINGVWVRPVFIS